MKKDKHKIFALLSLLCVISCLILLFVGFNLSLQALEVGLRTEEGAQLRSSSNLASVSGFLLGLIGFVLLLISCMKMTEKEKLREKPAKSNFYQNISNKAFGILSVLCVIVGLILFFSVVLYARQSLDAGFQPDESDQLISFVLRAYLFVGIFALIGIIFALIPILDIDRLKTILDIPENEKFQGKNPLKLCLQYPVKSESTVTAQLILLGLSMNALFLSIIFNITLFYLAALIILAILALIKKQKRKKHQ